MTTTEFIHYLDEELVKHDILLASMNVNLLLRRLEE